MNTEKSPEEISSEVYKKIFGLSKGDIVLLPKRVFREHLEGTIEDIFVCLSGEKLYSIRVGSQVHGLWREDELKLIRRKGNA